MKSKKFPESSVLYSPQAQTCEEGCEECLTAWTSYNGLISRKKPKNFIGSGGEAEVYVGKWHNKKYAFKHIKPGLIS